MNNYKLSYTAEEINRLLGKAKESVSKEYVDEKSSEVKNEFNNRLGDVYLSLTESGLLHVSTEPPEQQTSEEVK